MLAHGYVIIIKRDGSDGSIYPVTTSACSVGRGLQNDIRFHVQSVSVEHCVIYTSEFKPAVLTNLSNSNPTEVNNVPIHEHGHILEHGDIITTGERSLRWEYDPQSRYYIPSKMKDTRPLSALPLPGRSGMVGMPVSVLQSSLGRQPFSRQSVVITERKVKLSPSLVAANRQSTSSGDVPLSPSKLVAVVSPQRRPQSEKKAAEATNTSSPAGSSITESRNQSSAKSGDITPSNRKSSRLYSKSARKPSESDSRTKTLQRKRSLQALVTTRKTHKSVVGTPTRSRIPRLVYNFKHSGTGMPQSSKKRNSGGNFKKMTAISSVRKTKSEQKQPHAATAQDRKRMLESGLRSAERAAKRLKLESPKTPDKKKMAALLVCHRKVSRPKTPQIVSDVPHEVANTSAGKVKSVRKTMTAASVSHGIAVEETARKKYENLQTPVGDEISSNKHEYSMEIPASLNFSSGTVHVNVASGENHVVKYSPMRISQNSRRKSSLKTEQTVSPGLQVAADLHGVNKRVSPVKVTSRRKTAPPIFVNAVHTPAAVCPTGRHSHIVSADHTHDVSKSQITVSSDKKSRKCNVPEQLFKQLMNKSVQSTSAFSTENISDAKTSELLLSTPHTQRKSRSVTASCPVTSIQTNRMYSSRKSGKLSEKHSPESGPNSPHTRKCSSSPEIEEKARLISPSNTPVYKETTARKSSRFSKLGVQFPESVESSSGSQQTEGKRGSVAPSTCTSKLTASVRKSRTSGVTEAAESGEYGSEAPLRTGYKGKPVSSSTPAFKQSASTVKSRDAGVVGSLPKSVDQNSTSVGLRTPSRSPTQKDYEMVSSSRSFLLKQVSSQRISNSVGNLPSELHEEGPSSGSRYSESPYVPKSSGKRVHRLSRSETSLNSVSPQMSVLAQGADILHKRSSLKERVSQSNAYHTYLPSPGSQNTTFDFDSVETPCITLEDLVSPLSSNRKRKSLRWQDVSTSKEKQKSEPAFKRQRISERIGSNITFSGGSSLHSLPAQRLFTSLIDESVDTSHAEGKERGLHNNSISERVTTRSSYGSASPKSHGIQKLMKKASRISKTPENNLFNVSGVRQLMKIPSSLKSSVNDMSAVHGGMKLITTPRTQKLKTDSVDMAKLTKDQKSPKSPKKNLIDIPSVKQLMITPRDLQSPRNDLRNASGVKQLMKTPKRPNSPKNDLRDVRGVKQLMAAPKSPKSPKNDLRDVRGVRKLLTTPKSPKSPKNDLRDVRGVRQLMTTPKSPKSPKNDLRDVRGVRNLMTTPKSPKSPKNDLRDVRGVRKLLTTPKSPKSPKNDLRDVRGVRQLVTTPKSPKSPKNDLRDVRGVKQLMKTPKSQKSPRNDLRDVCGVKRLMASPKSIKSPLNDLTDIRDVRRLMKTTQVTPKNDLTDVVSVKDLTKRSSPRSSSKGLTDTNDVHCHVKTSLPPQSPEFGGHASQTESMPKSPERSIVQGVAPFVVSGTHRTRHGTKFINEVPEADRSIEVYANQKTVPMLEDIKRSNTRITRNRKEPDLGTLQVEVADISPKPPVKKLRQKRNKKTESAEDLSPSRNLEISPGPTVTSVASRQVHWNIPNSPSTPGDRVTRRKNVAINADVELPILPPRSRRTMKSKGSIMTEESSTQEDINDPSVSFRSVRKTRGRQLTSAGEISLSPTRRKQGTGVITDVEVSPLLKKKRGITATAEVESPLPSKRQQGNTAKISLDESSPPRKRRGGIVNGSEHPSSPKRLHVTVTEDTGDTVTAAALTSRRRRGAAVVTEVEVLQSPVTKKTRGKLAVRSAVAPTADTVPNEDLFSASDKQPATEESLSPPGKRRKRGTKPVEPLSPVPARKLRGIKLSDVGEEKSVSSNTRTRNKKPKVTSSPVSTAKSPPAVSRRGGKKTAKKAVSPQVTTERQARAASRRKK